MSDRHTWKNLTSEDATDSELNLVDKIFGPKPQWMSDENWRLNMRACAKDIREHVAAMQGSEACASQTNAETLNPLTK